MRRHLNTLFITTEGAWLAKDGMAVDVRVDHESRLRVPLHNLDGIVCFGWDIGVSPQLMGACTENNVSISFLSPHGKLLANVAGFTSGNVLLRREQYRRADDEAACLEISRPMVAAKIANSRTLLLRAVRDHPEKPGATALDAAAQDLTRQIDRARRADSLDRLRGIEGDEVTRRSFRDRLLTSGPPRPFIRSGTTENTEHTKILESVPSLRRRRGYEARIPQTSFWVAD